jgi:two-component system, OmpR family, sensor histidine kinase BaeS
MTKPAIPRIGKMWFQLTLAFVGVALAAVLVGLLIFSITIGSDFNQLARTEDADTSHSVATACSTAYGKAGWAHADLAPLLALVRRSGSALEILNDAGRPIRISPRFATIAAQGPTISERVIVGGKLVGTTKIAFGHGEVTRLMSRFTAERWRARVAATIVAVLIALLVALPLARLITAPIDRLIWAARGRKRGSPNARVGNVRGLGRLRELSLAFDEMADAKEEEDQLRRNLVADVAHELRTPIAVLAAGHEAMLDGITEPTPDQISSLHDEVLRLARMVDDLQRLASAEAAALQLKLIRRDLAAVAAKAAASLADAFEAANVILVERLANVEVTIDPMRMHEVVVNLLTNALKFTPSGGDVTLETHRSGDTAQLTVSDTGIGIPADELPHVAERFFRGKRSSEVAGSGIGLTIVAELVQAHHGSFDISSELGRGTTVMITLPLGRSGWANHLRAQREPRPPSTNGPDYAGIVTNLGRKPA